MNRWHKDMLRTTLGRVDGSFSSAPSVYRAFISSREHKEMIELAKELPDVFEIDEDGNKAYLRCRWLKSQGRTSFKGE